jgi:hypothetical protein
MTTTLSNEQPVAPRRRPSIVAVGVLFLVLGILDLWRGLAPLFGPASRLAPDDMQVLAIGVAALVGGGFLLAGHGWARWLLAAWMLLHVVISVGHPGELVAHVVIFGFVTYLLFRSPRGA